MQYKKFPGVVLILVFLLVFGACSFGSLFAGEEEKKITPLDGRNFSEPEYINYTVSRIHYEGLSVTQQQAYRLIYNSVFDHPERIKIPPITLAELKAVVTALKDDNPHLLCLDNQFSFREGENVSYFMPEYTASHEDCVKRTEALMEAAREISSAALALPQGYDRELYIHDLLCSRINYVETENSVNAYGALIEGNAVCEGYSYGAKLLFDLTDIPACVIRGIVTFPDGREERHMWNAVKIAGSWYHTDLTWDDPLSDRADNIQHAYFNVATGTISATHRDFSIPAPIRVSQTENETYYKKNGLLCTEENWKTVISSRLARAFKEELSHLEFKFRDAALLSDVKENLFEKGGLYELADDISAINDKVFSYSLDEDMNVLHIFL